MSLRDTKVFQRLFPLHKGDYVRFKRHYLREDKYWRYGTVLKVGELTILVSTSPTSMGVVYRRWGDKIERARRRNR